MRKLMLLLLLTAALGFGQFFNQGPFIPGKAVTKGTVTITCKQYFVQDDRVPRYRLEIESKDPEVNAFLLTMRIVHDSGFIGTHQIVVAASMPLLPITSQRVAVLEGIFDVSKIRSMSVTEQKSAGTVEF